MLVDIYLETYHSRYQRVLLAPHVAVVVAVRHPLCRSTRIIHSQPFINGENSFSKFCLHQCIDRSRGVCNVTNVPCIILRMFLTTILST